MNNVNNNYISKNKILITLCSLLTAVLIISLIVNIDAYADGDVVGDSSEGNIETSSVGQSIILDDEYTIDNATYGIYKESNNNEEFAFLKSIYIDSKIKKLGNFQVPETIEITHDGSPTSYEVRKIGNGFDPIFDDYHYGCTELVVGKNVHEIANKAFYWNWCINKISGDLSNLEIIGQESFFRSSIKSFCDSNTSITDNKINNFVAPENLINIGEYAFYNCEFCNLCFPKYTSEDLLIGQSAFEDCEVTSVEICPLIKNIGYRAFVGLMINPDKDGIIYDCNKRYILDATNNVLINKRSLILDTDSDALLKSVEVICGGAFSDNPNVDAQKIADTIIINNDTDNVLYICDRAFSDVHHLEKFLVKQGQLDYSNTDKTCPFAQSFRSLSDNQRPIFAGNLSAESMNLPDFNIVSSIRSNVSYLNFEAVSITDIDKFKFFDSYYYYFECPSNILEVSNFTIQNNENNTNLAIDLNGHKLICNNNSSAFIKCSTKDNSTSISLCNSNAEKSTISTKDKEKTNVFFNPSKNTSLSIKNININDWNENSFIQITEDNCSISICDSIIKSCNKLNDSSFIELQNLSSSLYLDNVKVDGLKSNRATFVNGSGSIICKNSTFCNCLNNEISLKSNCYNGGVFSLDMANDSTFKNCKFYGNIADDSGGVFYVNKNKYNDESNNIPKLTFADCVFGGESQQYKNICDDGSGACICAYDINLEIIDSSFVNNYANYSGGAIFAYQCKSFKIATSDGVKTSTFKMNCSNGGNGGAIWAFDISDFTIYGNVVFDNNSTKGGTPHNIGHGAALYCDECNLNIAGVSDSSQTQFVDNKADHLGGAIYFVNPYKNDEAVFIPHFSYCKFESNYASWKGGAIYSEWYLNVDHSEFLSNYCDNGNIFVDANGGAIYSKINNNYGGDYSFDTCKFEKNHAEDYGGALCINTGNSLSLVNCIFKSNYSEKPGGGIWVTNINDFNIKITESFDTENNIPFYDNYTKTDEGGCIYVKNSSLSISGIDKNILLKFYKNHATKDDGGAIYSYNSSVELTYVSMVENWCENQGGAIRMNGGKQLSLMKKCLISGNYSTSDKGGAFYIEDTTLNASSLVDENLYVADDSKILFDRNHSYFKEDDSEDGSCGGAIFSDDSSINLTSVDLKNNYSKKHGGAIDMRDGDHLSIKGFCNIESNNSIDGRGGAFYLEDTKYFNIKGDESDSSRTIKFCGNHSRYYGGCIYYYQPRSAKDSRISFCLFEDNTCSEDYGGAIMYNEGDYKLIISGSAFNNNYDCRGESSKDVNYEALAVYGNNDCLNLTGVDGQVEKYNVRLVFKS